MTIPNPPSGRSANVSTENSVYMDFEITDLNGVTLPGRIVPGDSWSQSLTLESTQPIHGTSFPATNEATNNCEAVGIESLTLQAATFKALRVECQNTIDVALDMDAVPIQRTLSLSVTSWYAEGVELVKTITTGMGLDITAELVSYSIP